MERSRKRFFFLEAHLVGSSSNLFFYDIFDFYQLNSVEWVTTKPLTTLFNSNMFLRPVPSSHREVHARSKMCFFQMFKESYKKQFYKTFHINYIFLLLLLLLLLLNKFYFQSKTKKKKKNLLQFFFPRHICPTVWLKIVQTNKKYEKTQFLSLRSKV